MASQFEIYKDKAGEFRFRLKSDSGKNLLASEGYKAKSGCTNGIESVKKNAADDARYDRKETKAGKYTFNLKAGNNQIIATGPSFDSVEARDAIIQSVESDAAAATTDDQSA